MSRSAHGLAQRALALAALWAGCSGIRVSSDWDPRAHFADLHTWNWSSPEPAKVDSGDARAHSPLLHQRIQAAIEDELANHGYRKSETGTPDFWVNYQVAIDQRLEVEHRGYGRPYGGGIYGGSETYVQPYDEGTLLINVVDGPSQQLLWRGWAETRLQDYKDPAQRDALAREAVAKIFERFPPPPAPPSAK